jgi:hypothetical protein
MRKTLNRLTKCGFFIVLAFIALILFPTLSSFGAATQVKVVVPAGTEVYTRFNATVTIADVVDLYAWQIKLYYNSTALKWINATLPAGHIFDGKLHISVDPINDTDAGGAYMEYFATLEGDAQSFTGSGILCQITFEAKNEGTSKLTFSTPLGPDGETWLSKYDLGYDISFTTVDGPVTIQESSDVTPPSIQITYPLNNSEVKAPHLTITWSGVDEASGIGYYEVSLDGGTWADMGMNTNYTVGGLGEGSHTFDLKAFDGAGNMKQATAIFSVNTSPLFGPGYMEEAAISVAAVAAILGTIMYFYKSKKPKDARHEKKLH